MIEPVTVNFLGLARDLNLPPASVTAVVELLNDETPIPFIARFRKDATGNMNEEQIRAIAAKYREQKLFTERKAAILRSLENAEKLTPELEKNIRSARSPRRLNDLYAPFKQPKQSLAAAARKKGLQPLADLILAGTESDLQAAAARFVNPEAGVSSADEALSGAGHIISEQYSSSANLRQRAREIFERTGKIVSQKMETAKEEPEEPAAGTAPAGEIRAEEPAAAEDATAPAGSPEPAGESGPSSAPSEEAASPEPAAQAPAEEAPAPAENKAAEPPVPETARPKAESAKEARKNKKKRDAEKRRAEAEKRYSDYFDFSAELRTCPAYRILTLNRGINERRLKVRLVVDAERVKKEGKAAVIPAEHPHRGYLEKCLNDSVDRLLLPSIEREVRRDAVENAKKQAIRVYAKNSRNLLLQKPLFRRRVLAIAPGFRYGCKMAALDEFGNFLAAETVYVTGGAERRKKTIAKTAALIEKCKLTVIAIGNGVGGRETEKMITELIAQKFPGGEVAYTFVNEAGAAVYAVSSAAAQELPNQDSDLRLAISIGRRLQDPLNELVKIEPANMGVGIYQHDLKPKDLKEALTEVVESAVNYVGVDLNTATGAILRYVSGFNQRTANQVAEYRRVNGPFRSRRDLLNVPGFGEAAFTHAAGFLKIRDGNEPLDATWIHPESYELAEKILEKIGFSKDDLRNSAKHAELTAKLEQLDPKTAAQQLGAGESTVTDIFEQLRRPGNDPREELPAPIFKGGVFEIENLEPGMELKGTVLNVVDFGAFVDIGLRNPGLVHISRMGDRFIRDAHELVAVGDIVTVWVVSADKERKRISLSMLPPGAETRSGSRKGKSGEPDSADGAAEEKKPRRRPRRKGAAPASDSSAAPRSDGQPHGSRDSRTGAPSEKDGRRENRPPRRPRPEGADRAEHDDRGRPRRDRFSGPREPRSMKFISKLEKKETLSQEMKEGKEPLRSFGDLARLFSQKEEEKAGRDAPQPKTPHAEPSKDDTQPSRDDTQKESES